MGPVALFDKSFLQGLSVDESVWFDRFFIANVCPLFYVETLGDLEKRVREGRTPDEEVGLIAEKFPGASGVPNAHHCNLCVNNLAGHRVPMTGQVPLSGGRAVSFDGKRGMVFKEFPEAEAFNRWQRGEFLEIERLHAKVWRERLSPFGMPESRKFIGAMASCKSLSDAKILAEKVLTAVYVPIEWMRLILLFLNIPWDQNEEIFNTWRRASYPPLRRHAPYVAYVLTVELFFHAAVASGLISSERGSNRADIAYLYYLPFCQLFVSSDRLHQRCAPLFLRDDQQFVWGLDLKEGLAKLNSHYSELPDHIKREGILSFAGHPPAEGDFMVNELWDRHFPNWRESKRDDIRAQRQDASEMISRIKGIGEAPPLEGDDGMFDPKKVDMLMIQRMVKKRKGSWWQIPKDLDTSQDG